MWNESYSGFTKKRLSLDYQEIEDNIISLHSSVVMVGLNISKPLEHLWSNFHFGRHDVKLMYAFNNSLFKGSYMTDIIKNEVDANSSNIRSKLKNKEIKIEDHVSYFLEEMNDVGANKNSLFLVFGDLAYSLFSKHFSKHFPLALKCKHYSARGTQFDYVNGIWESITSYCQREAFSIEQNSFEVNEKMREVLSRLEQKSHKP